MTKKWSSTASMDGKTKQQASKGARRDRLKELNILADGPIDEAAPEGEQEFIEWINK